MTTLPETDQNEDQSLVHIDIFGQKVDIPAGSPPPDVKGWKDTFQQLGDALRRTIVGTASLPADAVDGLRGICRRIAGRPPADTERRVDQAHDKIEKTLSQAPAQPAEDKSKSIERINAIIERLRAKGNDVSLKLAEDGSIVIAIGNAEVNALALDQAIQTINSLYEALYTSRTVDFSPSDPDSWPDLPLVELEQLAEQNRASGDLALPKSISDYIKLKHAKEIEEREKTDPTDQGPAAAE